MESCKSHRKDYDPIKLDKEDTDGLIEALENDNLFWRMTAQRLLVEKVVWMYLLTCTNLPKIKPSMNSDTTMLQPMRYGLLMDWVL